MNSVYLSTNISIIIQIISGLIGFSGLFINIPEKHKILQNVLTLETFVQFFELMFYIFVLQSMSITSLHNMATKRYFNWFITTPIMLLTSIIFFKYEEYLENNVEKKIDFLTFLKTEKDNIIIIITCNFLMLFFGYLGEIGIIDMTTSLTLGFLFFGITFYYIYKNYAVKSKNATLLFYYIFLIWGSYGIASIMEPELKNNIFNVLDIFSKNFFGLYLYYRISKIKSVH
jgi:bacteriorhodopsin